MVAVAVAVAVAMAWRGRASRGLGRSRLQWHTPGRQCRAVPFRTQSPRCSTSPECACDGEDRRQPLGRQNETRLSGLLTDAFALEISISIFLSPPVPFRRRRKVWKRVCAFGGVPKPSCTAVESSSVPLVVCFHDSQRLRALRGARTQRIDRIPLCV